MTNVITKDITIRPAEPNDHVFIYGLFRQVCLEKLNALHWPEQQQTLVTDMQYRAHRTHHKVAAGSEDFIILCHNEPCGRLLTGNQDDSLLIRDLAIHPALRNQGIASRIIEWICKQAATQGKTVKLWVDKTNLRAVRLYTTLGFRVVGNSATDHEMMHRS